MEFCFPLRLALKTCTDGSSISLQHFCQIFQAKGAACTKAFFPSSVRANGMDSNNWSFDCREWEGRLLCLSKLQMLGGSNPAKDL